jgi:hypothetical protein
LRLAFERLYRTLDAYQQDLALLGQPPDVAEEERWSGEAAYYLRVKRKVLDGLGFVLSKCAELDFTKPENLGAKEMAERVLWENFGVASGGPDMVK